MGLFVFGQTISGATSSTYSTTTLSNNDQINVTSTAGYTSGSISSSNLGDTYISACRNITTSLLACSHK